MADFVARPRHSNPGLTEPQPPIDPLVPEGLDIIAELVLAEEAINAKWDSLGGAPGQPIFPLGPENLRQVPNGYRRDYTGGSIYRRNKGPRTSGFMRIPQPYFLGPPTDQRYDQLGGPGGYLGFPVSDFKTDPEQPDSGKTDFQNGAIYFWPDVGAIEMQEISLRFVGLHCFGESDEWSPSDEVYFTFGVLPRLQELRCAKLTGIFNGVDSGESRSDLLELYRGLPLGAAISITLREHDRGDPNEYRRSVEFAVNEASGKVAEGLAEIPAIGAVLAITGKVVLFWLEPAITEAISEALADDDNTIGTVVLALTPKDMMRLTRVGRQDFHGIQAHLESPLISGLGASYKAYFDVEVA